MRRSNRSATIPAGTDSSTYGSKRTAPNAPTRAALPEFAVDHDEDRDDVQPVADPADELAEQESDERAVA